MMCPIAKRRGRIALAELVAAQGGNLRRWSELLGLSPAGGLFWMRDHAPELLDRLKNGRGRDELPPGEALARLVLLKSVEGRRGGQAYLAQALGITDATLFEFKKRWAPDGLDAAIADLMPEAAHG